MSYEQNVREWYRNYLGREPEPAGLNHWVNQLNSGANVYEIAHQIQYSDEGRRRAAERQTAASNAFNNVVGERDQLSTEIGNLNSKLAGYETQLNDYRDQVLQAQNNYSNALGQVAEWQKTAGEYQSQASDWENQFNQRTADWEAARDEAQRYRDMSVGQQLAALRSGATAGGSNSTANDGNLASGKTQYQGDRDRDGIVIDKDIKAESGILSNKGPVVERIARPARQSPSAGTSSAALAGGGNSRYYASRFR